MLISRLKLSKVDMYKQLPKVAENLGRKELMLPLCMTVSQELTPPECPVRLTSSSFYHLPINLPRCKTHTCGMCVIAHASEDFLQSGKKENFSLFITFK